MSTGGPSDRQHAQNTSESGGRNSRPIRQTHVPSSGSRSGEPPNLTAYSDTPRYDLATVVQLVGVRPMILWGWEQSLGIPAPTRVNEDAGNTVRRYSERDLVASLWLREQILNGTPPPEAAARLRAAQRPTAGDNEEWNASASGQRLRGPVYSGPLPDSFVPPQRSPNRTRPLSDVDRAPLGLGSAESMGPPRVSYRQELGEGPSESYGSTPSRSHVWVSPLSGPLGGRQSLSNPVASAISGVVSGSVPPTMAAGPLTGQLGSGVEGRAAFPITSGPLPPPAVLPDSPPVGSWTNGGTGRSVAWTPVPGAVSTTSTSTHGREVRNLMPQLLRAFANFDTLGANHIVEEALSSRSVETVCVTLLQPALARVRDQWASHQVSVPEERFATNYVRGLLMAMFYQTPERVEAPTVWVGCGPRETHDIHALVLAVFLRRAGLRAVYLGQDIDGAELVEEARKRRPALVAISVTSTQRIRALARIAKAINQLDTPRPVPVFIGPIFARNPELQRKINGLYLGDDMGTATYHAKKLLGMDAPTVG